MKSVSDFIKINLWLIINHFVDWKITCLFHISLPCVLINPVFSGRPWKADQGGEGQVRKCERSGGSPTLACFILTKKENIKQTLLMRAHFPRSHRKLITAHKTAAGLRKARRRVKRWTSSWPSIPGERQTERELARQSVRTAFYIEVRHIPTTKRH